MSLNITARNPHGIDSNSYSTFAPKVVAPALGGAFEHSGTISPLTFNNSSVGLHTSSPAISLQIDRVDAHSPRIHSRRSSTHRDEGNFNQVTTLPAPNIAGSPLSSATIGMGTALPLLTYDLNHSLHAFSVAVPLQSNRFEANNSKHTTRHTT